MEEDWLHSGSDERADIFCQVFEDHRVFFREAAILAGLALGLFDRLVHPFTCEHLCVHLNIRPHRLRALLNVLVLERFLGYHRETNTYVTAKYPEGRPVLPEYGWGLLAQVIRSDSPLGDIDSRNLQPEMNRRLHDHLFEIGYPVARRFWRQTCIGSGNLLDIGSGSGGYTAAFLDMNSQARATLVDHHGVLELARQRLKTYSGRLQFESGDAFDSLPIGYGTALLANVLHLYGPKDCAGIIANAARALRPLGRLVIKDLWITNDLFGPAVSLYFALNMALYTESGDVHSPDLIQAWMKDAGIIDVRSRADRFSLVVIGTKAPGNKF
jgi:SAM-dependent methyltransferase